MSETQEKSAEQLLAEELEQSGKVLMKFREGVKTPSVELSDGPFTAVIRRNGNKPVEVPGKLASAARRSGLLEDAPAAAPTEEQK